MGLKNRLRERHYILISTAIAIPITLEVSRVLDYFLPVNNQDPVYRKLTDFPQEKIRPDFQYEEMMKSIVDPL